MSSPSQNQGTHLRGTRLNSSATISQQMDNLRTPGDPGLFWGGLYLPTEDGPRHFCVMGTTGSGKTVLLRLLMQSVLPGIGEPDRAQTTDKLQTPTQPPAVSPSITPPVMDPTKNPYFKTGVGVTTTLFACAGMLCLNGLYAFGILLAIGGALAFNFTLRKGLAYQQKHVDDYAEAMRRRQDQLSPTEEAKAQTRTRIRRALVYDAKQDVLSILRGINPDCPIYILNPFDGRCAAWDMAKDIIKPSTAQQVATILVPENENASQPYFSNAARAILSGVFQVFIQTKPGTWTFRDVVLALKSKSRVIALLAKHSHTADLVEQYFSNPDTSANVMSELATHMASYEHIAASWSKATKKVSLHDWIKSDGILVLGNDEGHRSALDAVNRLLFQRLTEIVLSQPETSTEQTWIFLDEVREAGKLDGLSRLLNKGRSKGACVVLGFQDIDGMRAVHGEEIANEIIGQCNHMAMLRLNSPKTAEWASKRIGECETIDEDFSIQHGTNDSTTKGTSTGVTRAPGLIFKPATSLQEGESYSTTTGSSSSTTKNRKKVIKAAVLESEFLGLPLTNRANGLSGYFIVPQVRAGAYLCEMPGQELFPLPPQAPTLLPRDPYLKDFVERPAEHEFLQQWTEQELIELGLAQPVVDPVTTAPPVPKAATTPPPQKTPVPKSVPGAALPNIRNIDNGATAVTAATAATASSDGDGANNTGGRGVARPASPEKVDKLQTLLNARKK